MSAIWASDGPNWRLLSPAGFPDEAALHSLVAETPELLPLSGSPELIVVGREVALATGKADLLAVEPSGRLVLIEVKLGRNAEARRAVIAQVLAYSAALYGIDPEALEHEILGPHLRAAGHTDVASAAASAAQEGFEATTFERGLAESLSTGRFRIVLVLDEAPADLVRLVGYLEVIGEHLIVDLITVTAYDVDGSRVLVPQRVEPERQLAEPRKAIRSSSEPGAVVPGSDDFRRSIDDSPQESQADLRRLCAWAEQLEQEGLTRLYTRYDKRGWKLLLLRLLDEDRNLVSIWNDGRASLNVYEQVLDRRAPNGADAVRSAFAPLTLSKSIYEFSPQLLDTLKAAFVEAKPGLMTEPRKVGGHSIRLDDDAD